MRRFLLGSLLIVTALSVNAQRLVFDSFQAGKISMEALLDHSKEALGPKEAFDCYIEVQIDEKKLLRFTLSDKSSNSQTTAANRNAINSLKKKLKEILPN